MKYDRGKASAEHQKAHIKEKVTPKIKTTHTSVL